MDETCHGGGDLSNICNKTTVRELAKFWELSVWDKPASPCLSSRIAYGEEVTRERLRMIDEAEVYVRSKGFKELRVRYHRGDLARIEVPEDDIDRLIAVRSEIQDELRRIGFKFVTIDLNGLRSGSLNSLIQIEVKAISTDDE